MTSHVIHTNHAHPVNASVGKPAELTATTAPVSFVRQVLDLVKAVYNDPAAASEMNHPWLNATIRNHMSNRAHRLMRSDY
jgi:hypothetical protein